MTTPTVLPELEWHPTHACSPRYGHPVRLIVCHRWGVRYVSEPAEAASYEGVIRFFSDPANRASAHIVHPGSAAPGQATQMVAWDQLAWAEAAYNAGADEIEFADACWLPDPSRPGHVIDEHGLAVGARMVADRLHVRGLPPVWSTTRGLCRHADLGIPGGGHSQCPTTDLALWRRFVSLVQHEHGRGDFLHKWGR